MKIQKPELNQADRDRANGVYFYMARHGNYVTKEELCAAIGWSWPKHDRQIREIISIVAKKFPIISTSDNRGYKLVTDSADLDEIKHQLNELDKRKRELDARRVPLLNFLDRAARKEA